MELAAEPAVVEAELELWVELTGRTLEGGEGRGDQLGWRRPCGGGEGGGCAGPCHRACHQIAHLTCRAQPSRLCRPDTLERAR